MATFSVNQVKQLYVVGSETANVAADSKSITAKSTAGTIAVGGVKTKTLYFTYKGVDSTMRSDIIDVNNIIKATATSAIKMRKPLTKVTVALDKTINSGNPISGEDYILRILIRQFGGMSDEDQYFKYGVVHATAADTPSTFYKKLALSLAKNFSREAAQIFKFSVTTGSAETEVTPLTDLTTLSGTYTGVVIEELPQDWILGKMSQDTVQYEVFPTTVQYQGDDVIWGTATKSNSTTVIQNGKTIADMEYFYMGERGDIYRGMGYPNNFDTTYLVNPSLEYNVIDIHYAYVGDNESAQKSEKDICIVIPRVGTTASVGNALANSLITKINTQVGVTTIAPLSTSTSLND